MLLFRLASVHLNSNAVHLGVARDEIKMTKHWIDKENLSIISQNRFMMLVCLVCTHKAMLLFDQIRVKTFEKISLSALLGDRNKIIVLTLDIVTLRCWKIGKIFFFFRTGSLFYGELNRYAQWNGWDCKRDGETR